MSWQFVLTSLIVILLPGTGVIYTLAFGLGRGWRASVLAAFGCTLGIIPAIAASVVGLSALLNTSALAFQAIKVLGVAYLFFMAWSVLRERGGLQITGRATAVPAGRIVLNGFLLNILNPKLSLFFLAFLPQFIPVDRTGATVSMLELGAFFMLLTFVVFVIYGAFASATRHYVLAKPRVLLWLKRVFAGAFVALGFKLALSTQ